MVTLHFVQGIIMVLRIFFSIRSSSVPKMFMNLADDMLARSTVETWVIKAEKGEQGRATFIGDNLFIQLERQICQIELTVFKIFAGILKFAQKSDVSPCKVMCNFISNSIRLRTAVPNATGGCSRPRRWSPRR